MPVNILNTKRPSKVVYIYYTRFWGKMFGLRKNYFVVEVDLTEEGIEKRALNEAQELEKKKESDEIARAAKQDLLNMVDPKFIPNIPTTPVLNADGQPGQIPKSRRDLKILPIPQSQYVAAHEIPSEVYGTGLNRNTYYVCNELGNNWIELPAVTPQQLIVSRKITKYLTGDLNATVYSYPTFPGTEKHYLRALIARITSATYVAPIGYYSVSGEDEEEELEEEENESN